MNKMNKLITVAVVLAAFLCVSLFSLNAQAVDETALKAQIQNVLGGKESWKAKLLANLKAGMSCDDVKKVYSTLEGCDPAKDYSFPSAKIADNPVVYELKFTFKTGKLKGAELKFKTSIDSDAFKKVSEELFIAKWGDIKPEKKGKDILTKVGPGFTMAQRSKIGGIWQIKFDFPKTE